MCEQKKLRPAWTESGKFYQSDQSFYLVHVQSVNTYWESKKKKKKSEAANQVGFCQFDYTTHLCQIMITHVYLKLFYFLPLDDNEKFIF